jgi:glycosyltransferase involved in cell wall biosynthesis
VSRQIETIRQQQRPPDELVIRDDQSSDKTVLLVRDAVRGAPFPVSLAVNDAVLGVAANFGAAIAATTGDVVVLADQDDAWANNRLSALEETFEQDHATLAAFSDAHLINDGGSRLPRTLWQAVGLDRRGRRLVESGRVLEQLCRWNTVTGATLAFRGTLKPFILPVPDAGVHDAWIALVAALLGEVRAISTPLLEYRLHGTNVVGVPSRDPRQLLDARASDVGVRDAELAIVREAIRRATAAGAPAHRISRVEERERLLADRASLPTRPPQRLPRIVRNVVAGRYHRCAHGWRSAAHDLVFGP